MVGQLTYNLGQIQSTGFENMVGQSTYNISKLQLTFGIELEGQAKNDGRGRVYGEDMATVLKDAGFHVRVAVEADDENHEKWDFQTDASIYEDLNTTGFELVSRILPATQESFQEVGEVLDTLHQHFKLSTDNSTGFHVHVGNGYQGLPLRTLLNLSIIGTAFQRQIDSLHTPNRVTDVLARKYAVPITDVPMMGRLPTVYSRVVMLLMATTYDQLLQLAQDSSGWHWDKYFAYNFLPMLGLRTVEFRQHTGTLDPGSVVAWCRFVTGLVEFAHYADTAQMDALLGHINEQGFGAPELLDTLGMGDLRNYYDTRLYNHGDYMPETSSAYDLSGARMVQEALNHRETLMAEKEAILSASGRLPYELTCRQCGPEPDNPWLSWSNNPFTMPRSVLHTPWGDSICKYCQHANDAATGSSNDTEYGLPS